MMVRISQLMKEEEKKMLFFMLLFVKVSLIKNKMNK